MYVVFDQPLAYLSDSPPAYRKYPDILSFLSHVPSVWEQTVPLSAKVGEYAVMARKKGEEWYVGAMTNSTGRDIDIDFSFLSGDSTWTAEVYKDNNLTDSDAKEYTHETLQITGATKLKYRLSPEGGLAIRIHKEIATGLDNIVVPSKISVYSDLVHNQLVIQSMEDIKSVSIFDLSGKMRYQKSPYNQGYSSTIDISGFTKGIYIARILTSGKAQSFKFLK
jgi:alpha-glucosidase